MDASGSFQKAQAAAKRNSVDEAIEFWQQGLAADPTNLAERKKLREFEVRNVKAKSGLFSRGLSTLRSLTGSKSPKETIVQAEKMLASNPKDASALAALGQAASQLNDFQTALWSLQSAVEVEPGSAEHWKALGLAARGAKKPDLSFNAYKKALSISPKDYEAEKGMREAQSAKVMTGMAVTETKSGLSDRESAQAASQLLRQQLAAEKGDDAQVEPRADAPRPQGEPPAAQESQEKPREYRVADLMDAKAVLDPEERRRQLEIFEYLLEKAERQEDRGHMMRRRLDTLIVWEEYELAEIACNELIELDPNDPRTQMARGNIREAVLKEKTAKLKESGAAEEEVRKAEQEHADFQIENLKLQIDLRPSEGSLRIQYGKLLFDRKQYTDAAAAFQGAMTDQKLVPDALFWLGQCFHYLNLDALCERVFRESLEKLGHPRSDLAKQMHYTLGQFREAAGDWKGAFEEYAAIVEVDVTFQDALDKLTKIRDKLPAPGKPA